MLTNALIRFLEVWISFRSIAHHMFFVLHQKRTNTKTVVDVNYHKFIVNNYIYIKITLGQNSHIAENETSLESRLKHQIENISLIIAKVYIWGILLNLARLIKVALWFKLEFNFKSRVIYWLIIMNLIIAAIILVKYAIYNYKSK